MRAKKPKPTEEINIDNAIIFYERMFEETRKYQFMILFALKDKVKELGLANLFHDVDSQRFRCRLAALEKAESDRQAHEVTK